MDLNSPAVSVKKCIYIYISLHKSTYHSEIVFPCQQCHFRANNRHTLTYLGVQNAAKWRQIRASSISTWKGNITSLIVTVATKAMVKASQLLVQLVENHFQTVPV